MAGLFAYGLILLSDTALQHCMAMLIIVLHTVKDWNFAKTKISRFEYICEKMQTAPNCETLFLRNFLRNLCNALVKKGNLQHIFIVDGVLKLVQRGKYCRSPLDILVGSSASRFMSDIWWMSLLDFGHTYLDQTSVGYWWPSGEPVAPSLPSTPTIALQIGDPDLMVWPTLSLG